MQELAYHGGPQSHTKAWRSGPFHVGAELKALEKLLHGPALPMARGPAVMALRGQLQDLYGMKYAVPVSSGSAAIHVALDAVGVGAGDEVIVSPLTDYGSVIGVFQLNAIPVFADVDPDTMMMTPETIADRISDRTRAVMPVHNGGYPVDMPGVMRLARRHKIPVVEDCAQAHLAALKGRYLGTFGQVSAWSTNESKHLKSGEGGFVLTNSKAMAVRADLFADKCYPRFAGAPPSPAFPALNVRLNEINATLASVQLKRLPSWIKRRQAFAARFYQGLEGVPGIHPQPTPPGAMPSYWWTAFVVAEETLGIDALEFCALLSAEGIPAYAKLQQYVPGWEVFRTLDRDPGSFASYRPGRLKKGAYPFELAPGALRAQKRVAAVRMSQHNTLGEAAAAARAIKKIARVLAG